MALVAPQTPLITGATPTYGAVSSSDTYAYTKGTCFLIVKNASGSPITATVVVPGTEHGQAIPDVAVTVAATNGEKWIGPLDSSLVDRTTGNPLITVNYSSTTSVTAAYVVL